jgi:hypothetical protein
MSPDDVSYEFLSWLSDEAQDVERCRKNDAMEGRDQYESFDSGRLKQLERIQLFISGSLKAQPR